MQLCSIRLQPFFRGRSARACALQTACSQASAILQSRGHSTRNHFLRSKSMEKDIVKLIHATETKLVLYVTGGGSMVRSASHS
jgi:hypothetical protein